MTDFGVGPPDSYHWRVKIEWDSGERYEFVGTAPNADLAGSAAHGKLPEDAPVTPPDRMVVELDVASPDAAGEGNDG